MFKMAFRNIFRNTKRTFLTIIVIAIGMIGIIVGLGWLDGMTHMFIEEGTKFTGEIRISNKDFELKEKTLDTSSNFNYSKVKDSIKEIREIEKIIARIKFGGLILSDEDEDIGLGIGITEEDYDIINFKKFITEGRFLNFQNYRNEIILGTRIKNNLNLNLNDEVTILTSTQHGEFSALNYKIVGFFQMDNNHLNKSFYLKLEDAQYLLDMEYYITELLIFTNNINKVDVTKEKIQNKLINGKYMIRSWDEIGINKAMASMIPGTKFILALMLSILSAVGIANTMVMIIFERKKEIGILKSMGMKNKDIFKLLSLEALIIGVIGTIIGITFGSLLTYYFSKNGIELGQMVDAMSTEINIQRTLFARLNFKTILFTSILGINTALLASIISIFPAIKKEVIENLRN